MVISPGLSEGFNDNDSCNRKKVNYPWVQPSETCHQQQAKLGTIFTPLTLQRREQLILLIS